MRRFFKFFSLCLLFLQFSISVFSADVSKLILDSSDLKLRNFRTCSNIEKLTDVDTKGLADLKCSGSAQPVVENFAELKKYIKSALIVDVDLRQESHGFINEKYPISWYGKHNLANASKSLIEINTDELIKVHVLHSADSPISFTDKNGNFKAEFDITSVQTENYVAAKNNYIYIRLPVPDRRKPEEKIVNEFIKLVAGLSKDVWYHFHCKAGKGRTTTLMSMFDMMHNADKVSFNDILRRQCLLGGTNLFDTSHKKSKKIHLYKKERLAFLKEFYKYCRENKKSGFKTSWSEWEKRIVLKV